MSRRSPKALRELERRHYRYRDARPADLMLETDGTLQAIRDGALPATETTRTLAMQELAFRRLRGLERAEA